MAGILITFVFLSLITALRPYCTVGLSNLQSCALMAQFITLFGGILMIIDNYLSEEAQSAGETTSQVQQNIVTYAIYAANLTVMMWPVLQLAIMGQLAETVVTLKKSLMVFGGKGRVSLQTTIMVQKSTPISLVHHLSKMHVSSETNPKTGVLKVDGAQTFSTQGSFQWSESLSADPFRSREIHADIYIDV
jgi:hypothetical protein